MDLDELPVFAFLFEDAGKAPNCAMLFVIAENEEQSPWPSFSVEHGFDETDSVAEMAAEPAPSVDATAVPQTTTETPEPV